MILPDGAAQRATYCRYLSELDLLAGGQDVSVVAAECNFLLGQVEALANGAWQPTDAQFLANNNSNNSSSSNNNSNSLASALISNLSRTAVLDMPPVVRLRLRTLAAFVSSCYQRAFGTLSSRSQSQNHNPIDQGAFDLLERCRSSSDAKKLYQRLARLLDTGEHEISMQAVCILATLLLGDPLGAILFGQQDSLASILRLIEVALTCSVSSGFSAAAARTALQVLRVFATHATITSSSSSSQETTLGINSTGSRGGITESTIAEMICGGGNGQLRENSLLMRVVRARLLDSDACGDVDDRAAERAIALDLLSMCIERDYVPAACIVRLMDERSLLVVAVTHIIWPLVSGGSGSSSKNDTPSKAASHQALATIVEPALLGKSCVWDSSFVSAARFVRLAMVLGSNNPALLAEHVVRPAAGMILDGILQIISASLAIATGGDCATSSPQSHRHHRQLQCQVVMQADVEAMLAYFEQVAQLASDLSSSRLFMRAFEDAVDSRDMMMECSAAIAGNMQQTYIPASSSNAAAIYGGYTQHQPQQPHQQHQQHYQQQYQQQYQQVYNNVEYTEAHVSSAAYIFVATLAWLLKIVDRRRVQLSHVDHSSRRRVYEALDRARIAALYPSSLLPHSSTSRSSNSKGKPIDGPMEWTEYARTPISAMLTATVSSVDTSVAYTSNSLRHSMLSHVLTVSDALSAHNSVPTRADEMIAKLEHRLVLATEQSKAHVSENNLLRATLIDYNTQIVAAKERMAHLSHELDDVNQRLEATTDQHDTLLSELTTAQDSNETHLASIQQLQHDLDICSDQLKKAEHTIENERNETKDAIARFDLELQETRARLAGAEDQLVEKEQQLADETARANHLKEELKQLDHAALPLMAYLSRRVGPDVRKALFENEEVDSVDPLFI